MGRAIVDGARRVRISGHDVAVKAQVRRIDSYSAHADQDDIRAWIKARRPIAGSLFLTHGEADSIEALRRRLQSDAAADSIVTPQIGERSEEHTSELQSLMRSSYAVFCLKKKNKQHDVNYHRKT